MTRFTLRISSMRCSCVGRRPAVSARTTSMPLARADWMASKITAAESPFPARSPSRRGARPTRLQLLARRRAERVARGEQHGEALRLEEPRELARWWWSCPRRSPPRGGSRRASGASAGSGFSSGARRATSAAFSSASSCAPSSRRLSRCGLAQARDEVARGRDAHVGREELRLERLVERLVDLRVRRRCQRAFFQRGRA